MKKFKAESGMMRGIPTNKVVDYNDTLKIMPTHRLGLSTSSTATDLLTPRNST